MTDAQPNFEIVKKEFYNIFINHPAKREAIWFTTITNFKNRAQTGMRSYAAETEFNKDLNNWLNGVDIRTAGSLIDAVIEEGGSLPRWLKSKAYAIDYNKNGHLDLIRLQQD